MKEEDLRLFVRLSVVHAAALPALLFIPFASAEKASARARFIRSNNGHGGTRARISFIRRRRRETNRARDFPASAREKPRFRGEMKAEQPVSAG